MGDTTVEAANAEFYAAFEAADLDRMSRLWADGAYADSASCVHLGWPMLRGRAEVLRSWALIMANTSYIQFVVTDVHSQVFGEQAVVTCSEHILTAGDGPELGFASGGSAVSTNVFVRIDGDWRLWLHHGSPVLNQTDGDPE